MPPALDTRDIVIETKARLEVGVRILESLATESRQRGMQHDQKLGELEDKVDTRFTQLESKVEDKFVHYDAILNKIEGMYWFSRLIWAMMTIVGGAFGAYIMDHRH